MSDFLDTPLDFANATPKTLLRRATDINRESKEQKAKADAGMEGLGHERQVEGERRTAEREADIAGLKGATADLQGAMTTRQSVDLPNPDLGPPLDPKQTQNMAWGLLGMSLIGAVAGRKHFGEATAALDGMLRGFKGGAEEQIKLNADKFKREFEAAIAKQRQANSVYEDIIKSKSLSLNAQAEMMRIHAAAHEDWSMEAAAREKNFSQMYKNVAQNQTAITKLIEQAGTMQDRITARAEKAAAAKAKPAGDSGTTLSERYTTDPEYKKQVDNWAYRINHGIQMPARFAQSVGQKFSKDVYLAAGTNASGGEAVAGKLDMREMTAEAQKLGTQAASVAIANKEMMRFIPLAEQAIDAVPRTSWKPINQITQAAQNTWSPEQKALVIANRSVQNAFAQLIQRGAPTVHSLSEAEALLNTADSPEVYRAAMKQLRQEGIQAEEGLKDAREDLLARARGSSGGGENRRAGDNTFTSEAEAKAAADRGDLKPGTRITVNGQSGVWQ